MKKSATPANELREVLPQLMSEFTKQVNANILAVAKAGELVYSATFETAVVKAIRSMDLSEQQIDGLRASVGRVSNALNSQPAAHLVQRAREAQPIAVATRGSLSLIRGGRKAG